MQTRSADMNIQTITPRSIRSPPPPLIIVGPVEESGTTEQLPSNLVAVLIRFHEDRRNLGARPPCSAGTWRSQRKRESKVFGRIDEELRLSLFRVTPKGYRGRSYNMWVLYPNDAPPKFVKTEHVSSHYIYLLGWLGHDAGFESDYCAVRVWRKRIEDIIFDPDWCKNAPTPADIAKRCSNQAKSSKSDDTDSDSPPPLGEAASAPPISTPYNLRQRRQTNLVDALGTDSAAKPIRAYRKRSLDGPNSLIIAFPLRNHARTNYISNMPENTSGSNGHNSTHDHVSNSHETHPQGNSLEESDSGESGSEETDSEVMAVWTSEFEFEENNADESYSQVADSQDGSSETDSEEETLVPTNAVNGAPAASASHASPVHPDPSWTEMEGSESESEDGESMEESSSDEDSTPMNNIPGTTAEVTGSNHLPLTQTEMEESEGEDWGSMEKISDEEDHVPINNVPGTAADASTLNHPPLTPASAENGALASSLPSAGASVAPRPPSVITIEDDPPPVKVEGTPENDHTPAGLPPVHNQGIEERFSASAFTQNSVSTNRAVFQFVGDSGTCEDDFTLRRQQPGEELFGRAREYFQTEPVNDLYCFIPKEGRNIRLKGNYLAGVDNCIEQLEYTASFKNEKLVVYVRRDLPS